VGSLNPRNRNAHAVAHLEVQSQTRRNVILLRDRVTLVESIVDFSAGQRCLFSLFFFLVPFFHPLASDKRMRDEKLLTIAELIVATRLVYLGEREGRVVALCWTTRKIRTRVPFNRTPCTDLSARKEQRER